MLPLLARQARALERLLLQQRAASAAAAAATTTAAGAFAAVGPRTYGADSRGSRSEDDADIWADPFGDGAPKQATEEQTSPQQKRTSKQPGGRGGGGARGREAAARAKAPGVQRRAPVTAESAAAMLGADASSMAWLDTMAAEVEEHWRPAPETVVAVMEEARRSVAARRLPPKQMSQAVAKALQLSRAFPSLSPKDLLTEAVLHAQTGALAADVLLERASKLRRVLPDTPPTARLLRSLTAEEVSARILAAVRVFRSVLDTPMPVPLLDVPANLDRLLKTNAVVLRSRLQCLVGLLGPTGALAAVHARPVEAALTPETRLGPRIAGAQTILGCSDPLEAFSAAIALRNLLNYVEIFEAARDLGASTGAPSVQFVPLFAAYGAPAPAAVAADADARVAALRVIMPAAAPADLAILLRLAAARRYSPDVLAASVGMAASVLGLSPYRVLQMLLRDAKAAGRAILDAATAADDDAASDNGTPASESSAPGPRQSRQPRDPGAPRPRRRAAYEHLLLPPDALRARADEIGRLLGVSGPQLSSLLRYQPRLLAASEQTLRLRVDSLTSFLTGVDGGGAGGDPRLSDAARGAAQSALRLCPKLLHLDVSTCVERVRAVEGALRLPASAAWRMALREPQIMAQPKDRLHAACMRLHALAGSAGEARRVAQQSPSVLLHLCNLAPRMPRGVSSSIALSDDADGSGPDSEASDHASSSSSSSSSRPQIAAGGPYSSRLRWMASELGIPEGEALAAAVRSPAGRALLGDSAETKARGTAAVLARLMGRSVGEVLKSALGDTDGHYYSRLLTIPVHELESRAAAISSTLGLDAAPPERLAVLLRSAPNLLVLPRDTLETKVLGLADVLQELLPSLGTPAAAGNPSPVAPAGTGAAGRVSSQGKRQEAPVTEGPLADTTPGGGIQGVGVAYNAETLEAVCRAVLARPLLLGLATDGLVCRARRLRHVAEAFPPWAAQLAGPRGAAIAGRVLVFADARHDRLYYLLATGLASTSGTNGGPISLTAALEATDDAFSRRFPGYAAFSAVASAARHGGGGDGAAAAAWEDAAAPMLRPHGGARPQADAAGAGDTTPTAATPQPGASVFAGGAARLAPNSKSAAGRAVVLRVLREASPASAPSAANDGSGGMGLPSSVLVSALKAETGLAESTARELLAVMQREGVIASTRADTGSRHRQLLWRLPASEGAPTAAAGSGSARTALLQRLHAAGASGLPTAQLVAALQSERGLTTQEAYLLLRRLRRRGEVVGRRPEGEASNTLVWRLPDFVESSGIATPFITDQPGQQAAASCGSP